MATDQRTLGIVWAETGQLRPADGGADTVSRAHATVAGLAARAVANGTASQFVRPAQLPSVGSPDASLAASMVRTVDAVTSGTYGDLPRRAVLWEVTGTGQPRQDVAQLPASAQWVTLGQATHTSDFTLASDLRGRVFRLYESDTAPAEGMPAYISSLTGTGIAVPFARQRRLSIPWVIGIAASVLFIYAAGVTLWTGRTVAEARGLVAGSMPYYATAYIKDLRGACAAAQPAQAMRCEDGAVATGAQAKSDEEIKASIVACGGPKADANGKPITLKNPAFCLTAWRRALKFANYSLTTTSVGHIIPGLFGWNLDAAAETGIVSFGWPMAMLMLGIVGLGIALGLGTKGNVFGIWINKQNRISLARAQVSVWTIVILGAYAAVALVNAGMVGGLMRDAIIADGSLANLAPFATIPAAVLAALGISVGSPMISALIMSRKPKAGADPGPQVDLTGADDKGVTRFFGGETSGLSVRPNYQQPTLADLFLGEEEANKDLVDISRLQNVIFTVMLAFGYAALLFGLAREIDFSTVMDTFANGRVLLRSLPDAGPTFTTLLGVSHAAYLITKAAPKN